MIPATGYVALVECRPPGEEPWLDHVPIVAWSDDGDALVVDERAGTLTPARTKRGFIRLADGTPGTPDEGATGGTLTDGGRQ